MTSGRDHRLSALIARRDSAKFSGYNRQVAGRNRAPRTHGASTLRVLVVEDDPDLNRQLVAALSDAGYAVDRAMDGEEAYFLGETEPYDVVVLDIGLPKMDGISVLE